MVQKTHWDQKYSSMNDPFFFSPRDWLVSHAALLPQSGVALEVAAGAGANIPFLLQRGVQVMAVDRSIAGVRLAKAQSPTAAVILADLTRFCLPSSCFDLICNFYYLDRNLNRQFFSALKPGGLVIFETLLQDMLEVRPEISPDQLLKPGELRTFFWGWEVLDEREGWLPTPHGGRKAISSIVVRRPSHIPDQKDSEV